MDASEDSQQISAAFEELGQLENEFADVELDNRKLNPLHIGRLYFWPCRKPAFGVDCKLTQ